MDTDDREVSDQRDRLREDANCTFVGRGEFNNLLLSNRKLQRCDVNPARLRGLLDAEEDHLFVIEVEKLQPLQVVGAI